MKCKRIAVRRTWNFKPVTRVKQSKKIYKRWRAPKDITTFISAD